jgi:hypothetical protein
MKEFPADKQFIILANKLRAMGLLIDKETKYKRRAFTEEKLDNIGAT